MIIILQTEKEMVANARSRSLTSIDDAVEVPQRKFYCSYRTSHSTNSFLKEIFNTPRTLFSTERSHCDYICDITTYRLQYRVHYMYSHSTICGNSFSEIFLISLCHSGVHHSPCVKTNKTHMG